MKSMAKMFIEKVDKLDTNSEKFGGFGINFEKINAKDLIAYFGNNLSKVDEIFLSAANIWAYSKIYDLQMTPAEKVCGEYGIIKIAEIFMDYCKTLKDDDYEEVRSILDDINNKFNENGFA